MSALRVIQKLLKLQSMGSTAHDKDLHDIARTYFYCMSLLIIFLDGFLISALLHG